MCLQSGALLLARHSQVGELCKEQWLSAYLLVGGHCPGSTATVTDRTSTGMHSYSPINLYRIRWVHLALGWTSAQRDSELPVPVPLSMGASSHKTLLKSRLLAIDSSHDLVMLPVIIYHMWLATTAVVSTETQAGKPSTHLAKARSIMGSKARLVKQQHPWLVFFLRFLHFYFMCMSLPGWKSIHRCTQCLRSPQSVLDPLGLKL